MIVDQVEAGAVPPQRQGGAGDGDAGLGACGRGLDVAGVVWEATESADTRCWGLLPDKIQVLRLELPAGTHQLALQPVSANGVPQGPPQPATVQVAAGRKPRRKDLRARSIW